ncbi:ABC transporter ATP-binding protein [Nonomuraea sp. SMC257]|uniref:ABC transporter ATP-binding protein n=1 Tax=Nonomuraea montanisoli TaxID=2741721 RepID=A0A7Y6M757_9ACTN|nr:ABC transporter ATP-binding protein [Nonomuraea montanisoli]NUW36316.1 ABC transporter ATP-binding protein [Nonomuraea montanisoli]
MLVATDLVKRYGTIQALDGFSLNVAAGEIVGLVGHNGAGKSTFVEIVSYLIRPDGGHVTIDGRPPSATRGEVGVAPQHIALYPSATVREHLELYGRLAGLRRAALSEAVEDLSTVLRLGGIMDRRAGKLSGGQQRRTQAASALVHRPALLLLDEPTAGADLETRQAMLDVVKQRAGEGAAVVYTTHYLPELTELQATIAVAQGGRVIARGTCEELLKDLPGEVRVTLADREEVSVSTSEPTVTLIDLLRRIDRPISAVDVRNPSLDDLYRSLAVHDAP